MTTGAVCRPAPVWPGWSADGVRVRVDSGVNEKALRRVLSAVKGLDDRPAAGNEGLPRLPADRSARRVRRPGGQGAADHGTNRANGFNDRFAENQVKTLLSTAQKVPHRTQLSSSNSSIADLQAMMGTRRV